MSGGAVPGELCNTGSGMAASEVRATAIPVTPATPAIPARPPALARNWRREFVVFMIVLSVRCRGGVLAAAAEGDETFRNTAEQEVLQIDIRGPKIAQGVGGSRRGLRSVAHLAE